MFHIWQSCPLVNNSVFINFGPQHPAAHGVLRLLVQLYGECVLSIDAHIGYLHRGSEWLCLKKTQQQACAYVERLDYTSVLTQTHCFFLASEISLYRVASYLSQWWRTLASEFGRLLNHYLAITTAALDIGLMAPLFWGFEEREKIMEFIENDLGARMHALPCRVRAMPNWQLVQREFYKFFRVANKSIIEVITLLLTNKLWRARLQVVGIITFADALQFSLSGPLGRASGISVDWRLQKLYKYDLYSQVAFTSFIGVVGDCYDRFVIRLREVIEDLYILVQLIQIKYFDAGFGAINDMGSLITSFLNFQRSAYTNDFATTFVEAGKGLFGTSLFFLSGACLRCHFRSPAFYNLQIIKRLAPGHYFSDLTALLGTVDIVFGEVDR